MHREARGVEPLRRRHSPGWTSPGWGDSTGLSGPLKGKYFVFTALDTYSGFRFAFPTHVSLVRTAALSTIIVLHTALPLMGDSWHRKCADNEQDLMEFTDLATVPAMLKESMEEQNGILTIRVPRITTPCRAGVMFSRRL